MGYKTKVTSPTNDRGKDIIMWKNNTKYVVEVKLYAIKYKVGRPKIQKLHSAMIDSDADVAIYVTTSDYTEPAKKYAEKFKIKLINGQHLVKKINIITHQK